MYQEFGGTRQIRCTYVAWQQAYDRTGVALPAWSNGGTWLASAQNAGYSTGSEPRVDSIVVFKGVYANTYGHVAYVTAVNGPTITVTEGGYKEYATTGTYNSAVGSTITWQLNNQTWGNQLIGYIYLTNAGQNTNQEPWGNLDTCSMGKDCVRVKGWAFDPDDSGRSIDVHVYIGGAAGASGAMCIPIPANMYRSDVNQAYGISGNHGFDYMLFTDRSSSQEVHAYAIDTAGGNNADIGSGTVWCTPRTSDASVTEGIYYIVPANATDKCLDVTNASTEDGANVQLFSRNGTMAQQWQLTKLSDGSFKIVSLASGKALDVADGSASSGANVQQFAWNNSNAQHWFLVCATANDGDVYYYLNPKCSVMCLDVYDSGTNDGTNVTQYWCHGGSNQLFKFVRVEETGIDINEANFPDPIFRAYVSENFDLSHGGKLSDYEISKATTVLLMDSDVTSLKGIEFLTSLKELTCYETKVSELDLSKNTSLTKVALGDKNGSNPFADPSAVIASLPASVTELWCGSMSLAELDVSRFPNLKILRCDNNKLSGELDLSSCSNLRDVTCSDNELTRIVLPEQYVSMVECDNNHLVCISVNSRFFSCEGNTRTVETAEDGTFDLSTLPDFDVSRTENWDGGTVDGSILTFIGDKVTYTYNCLPGNQQYLLYKRTFTLIRKKKVDISETSIAAIPDQDYTGTALTPAPSITYGEAALVEGVDYTVAYQGNVGSSSEDTTATVTITGIGDYKGSTTITFKIVAPGNQGGTETPGGQGGSETPGNQGGSETPGGQGPTETPGNQMADDGTAVGEGASEQVAEQAIISQKTDSDLKGSTHTKLVFQTTKQTKNSISYKWKKVPGAKKYVLYGNACGTKNRMKKIATVKGTKYTLKKVAGKKVKKGKYYKTVLVAVDAKGKVISTSKTLHVATKGGKVGNNKKVKTAAKKNKVTLKRGKTFKLKAKAVPESTKLKVRNHIGVRYESTNNRIATVSKKGVIKGVRTGTCYVLAYSQDGKTCKVKVNVK